MEWARGQTQRGKRQLVGRDDCFHELQLGCEDHPTQGLGIMKIEMVMGEKCY